ncbi:MAG: hypothetical protein PHD76_14330 [Methylacidiphilales bacterium]|nr:hypothetical protein [Candidatus Methylacidiphilales bacterium]
MSAENLMETLLRHIRMQFYPDDPKRFFQEQRLLKLAITTPAVWLQERGVALSAHRLQAVLMDIITEIKRHGDTGAIKCFGAYLLHTVQQHMRYQGERYYNEGKAARNQVEKALSTLQACVDRPVENSSCQRLAELNQLLRAGRPRRRVAAKKAKEPDLFASCKGVADSRQGP